jgi:hypothetical protein
MFLGNFISAQDLPRVTVVNNTGYRISSLYIVQSAADDGEEDILRERGLHNGESYRVRLRYPLHVKNTCHIRLEDENGDTYTKWRVSIKPNSSIVFTRNDFDGGPLPPFDFGGWDLEDDFHIGPPPSEW